ncbi:MAG TPA: sigma-70 family RNA polymerase sigma factor [Candidatus Polarisedimenticolaceae bacterium]|nr:sigma-70 family RNA polymerase sigma factor [Candidatus Polarisedimenticolaceae bacterium]
MSRDDPQTVTMLLRRWRDGDSGALDRLMPLVYDELHRLAVGLMRSERRDHTLQATALIHEAYARLAGAELPVHDRAHFVSLSARVMRRVLVDYARARRREKRGSGGERVTLAEAMAVVPDAADKLIEIDELLDRLRASDERKSRTLELSLFGGLTQPEIAEALGVSLATVERDLRFARAWLRAELDR